MSHPLNGNDGISGLLDACAPKAPRVKRIWMKSFELRLPGFKLKESTSEKLVTCNLELETRTRGTRHASLVTGHVLVCALLIVGAA